ncbi:PREDICTED: UPF0725 protein At1g02770-like [Camelina sativa]|uniref:UPF0725 protein At1g02770-like n=1 Tax=Camelina sativa TaxID=90675 RepID=A0ABM1QML8_CAMSA|nr:PREDICTED: UPF0725 protein At1g02770-like [Camelina sativa]
MTSPFPLESPTAESVRGQMDSWCRGQMDYRDQVREAGFFDLEKISVSQGTTGLMPFYCDLNYPHPVLVKRYARLGIDRYNMSHGTNLQLHHLKKFNKTMNCQASYYITLAACDPANIDPASLVTLQVGVAEGSSTARCSLNLSCFIAKPQGTPTDLLRSSGMVDDKVQLPCWPSDFSDTQRFYEVIVRRAFNDRTGCLTAHGGYGFSIGEVAEEHHVSRPRHYTEPGALIPDQDPSS